MKRGILALGIASGLAIGSMAVGTVSAAHLATMTTHHVTLHSIGGSGVTGTATLTYNSKTKMTTVHLNVRHLKANSVHPAHIHTGHCGTTGAAGGVIHPFAPLKAGKNGVAAATTSFAGTYMGKNWAINVHTGPNLSPASEYKVIACGDIM